MNIFEVLSRGKSRINETSISAMLGYLLDTTNDHGIGDSFLRKFLSALASKNPNNSNLASILSNKTFIKADVTLEEQYSLKGIRKDIDIEISILDNKSNDEIHRIIIENKIRTGAANEKQLKEYYEAILEDDNELKPLSVVFLTPDSNNSTLNNEFNNLDVKPIHNKYWIKWNGADENSMTQLLRDILSDETLGKINPINDYLKHTIKALIVFLENILETKQSKQTDYGDIVDDIMVSIDNDRTYRILRRTSSQIQVFHNDVKIEAKSILREIIEKYNLHIKKDYNTRMMGKKVIEKLKEIGACVENQ